MSASGLSFLEQELRELKAQNLYRKCRVIEPVSPVRALFEKKEILLFCGNDYLGLSRNPSVVKAFQAAAGKGAGSGAARLISGTNPEHDLLEKAIARFKKKGKALLFTAGYLANVGTLSGLAGEGDLILLDKLCHASLIDGARLSKAEVRSFPHKNYERAEEILKTAGDYRRCLLVSDTVFSMDGDLADVAALVRLKKKYGAILLLDDAHETGVFPDDRGREAVPADLSAEVDVFTGTLSKAAGCIGGFAAASEQTVDYLLNSARTFLFATSLPPAVCAAAYEAFRVMENTPAIREKLWKNVRSLEASLKKAGFDLPSAESPILPVILGPEEKALKASEKLLEKGILVPAVRYPTVPKGKARLRITVSAAHTPEDLGFLCRAMEEIRGI